MLSGVPKNPIYAGQWSFAYQELPAESGFDQRIYVLIYVPLI